MSIPTTGDIVTFIAPDGSPRAALVTGIYVAADETVSLAVVKDWPADIIDDGDPESYDRVAVHHQRIPHGDQPGTWRYRDPGLEYKNGAVVF